MFSELQTIFCDLFLFFMVLVIDYMLWLSSILLMSIVYMAITLLEASDKSRGDGTCEKIF